MSVNEITSKIEVEIDKESIILNKEFSVPIPKNIQTFQHTQMAIAGYITQKYYKELKNVKIIHRYSIPHKIARNILRKALRGANDE